MPQTRICAAIFPLPPSGAGGGGEDPCPCYDAEYDYCRLIEGSDSHEHPMQTTEWSALRDRWHGCPLYGHADAKLELLVAECERKESLLESRSAKLRQAAEMHNMLCPDGCTQCKLSYNDDGTGWRCSALPECALIPIEGRLNDCPFSLYVSTAPRRRR